MTNSQERLEQRLTRLNGGKRPIKQWSLKEVINELLEVLNQPNQNSVRLKGEFDSRLVGDALVSSGFKVEVTDGESFLIVW